MSAIIARKNKIAAAIIIFFVITLSAWGVYSWRFQMLPQNLVQLLNDIKPPATHQKILIFAPHPDDETIATGGFIAKCIENGAQVWIVLVTDGNKHHLEVERYAEFKKATAILGVPPQNLIYLGYQDGKLKYQDPAEVRTRFEKIINQIQPDMIFFPIPEDHHPDHGATGKIVYSIIKNRKSGVYEYLVHSPNFPRPYGLREDHYMLQPIKMVTGNRGWIRFMLTQEEEDKKLQAVLQYKTQLKYPTPRGLLYGMVRRNELFAVPENN